MDQTSFNDLLVSLGVSKSNQDFFDSIHSFALCCNDCSIRDLSWDEFTMDNALYDVYSSLWIALTRCWAQLVLRDSSEWCASERLLLKSWFYVSTLPEYSNSIAVDKSPLTQDFVTKALKRMTTITTTPQQSSGMEDTLTMIKHLLHWLYEFKPELRPFIRSQIGLNLLAIFPYKGNLNASQSSTSISATANKWVVQASDAGNSRSHVSHLLELLLPILSGLEPLKANRSSVELLTEVLMPLHTPNEMIEWRDQIPVLQCYHEPLVRCLVKIIEKDQAHSSSGPRAAVLSSRGDSLLLQTINLLFKQWPESYKTNTPKQVLFLHELEILLELLSLSEFHTILQPFLSRMVKCIGTDVDNIRPAQRALQYFKNEKVLRLIVRKTAAPRSSAEEPTTGEVDVSEAEERLQSAVTDKVLRAILPALYRNGKASWNPTVNKMSALALKNIREQNEATFRRYCDLLFSPAGEAVTPPAEGAPLGPPRGGAGSHSAMPLPSRDMKRLKLSEGGGGAADAPMDVAEDKHADDKPSEKESSKPLRAPPPSFAGGMMPPPRAVNISSRPVMPRTAAPHAVPSTQWQTFNAANPPPVTITGVAPWAMNKAEAKSAAPPPVVNHSPVPTGYMTKLPTSRGAKDFMQQHQQERAASLAGAKGSSIAEGEDEKDDEEEKGPDRYELMCRYMEQCYPQSEIDKQDKAKSEWNVAQAAASPTLLPGLKFHDLVFGQELGEGAFSVVKYARHITKDKTQSEWPEYAVKAILAAKIAECQYLSSVVREMAVLQMLAHPGIARLISTFRYTDSAYLVLEYCAKGDLHTYLVTYGKLSPLHTRFVVGEITAALTSVHELGFCFNDLKPENVLITEIGHIKVTDFGASRPMTQTARDLLASSKSLLTNIRNGDWKEAPEGAVSGFTGLEDAAIFEDDDRLEGTPSYLPPEILMGKGTLSNTLADVWALGCLASFCLEGKPLFYGEKEDVLDQIKELRQRQHHLVHFKGENAESDADTFTQLGQFESLCATEFVNGLLKPDPAHRTPMSLVAQQDFLTQGYSAAHHSRVASAFSELPLRMDPLSLHLSAPIKLPVVNKRQDGASAADQQWARRQFSKLWSPMPAEYSLDGDEQPAAARISGDAHTMSDLWMQSHPHRLTAVEETDVERLSSFIVYRASGERK